MTQTKQPSETMPSLTGKWKPYPAYKDSGVEWLGEIPEHWEIKRLKFVADVLPGVAKGRDLGQRDAIELPYLRVANVQDGYLDLSDIATCSDPLELDTWQSESQEGYNDQERGSV